MSLQESTTSKFARWVFAKTLLLTGEIEMKKTLAAAAVLGAFAGSALAADVQLYGIVDTGLAYTHLDSDQPGVDATDSFGMESGQQSGSRFGLKGTEELGNGLKVGFILENGFSSDTGADKSVFFDRESSLFIEGGFGKLALGRMGSINGTQSSWSKIGMISAFGTSFGSYSAQAGNSFSVAGQWDNMIAYETPDFAGFKVFAQYGMGNNSPDPLADGYSAVENESSSDRYWAIGATYMNGPAAVYFAVDSINYRSWGNQVDNQGRQANQDLDDSLTVTLGGSWDFNVAKVFFGGQYFDEVRLSSISGVANAVYGDLEFSDVYPADFYEGSTFGNFFKLKGYSLSLSTSVPLAGGNLLAGVSYLDSDFADSHEKVSEIKDATLERYIVSLGYTYNLSKRTNLYGVASWMQDSVEGIKFDGAELSSDPSVYTFMIGLRHTF